MQRPNIFEAENRRRVAVKSYTTETKHRRKIIELSTSQCTTMICSGCRKNQRYHFFKKVLVEPSNNSDEISESRLTANDGVSGGNAALRTIRRRRCSTEIVSVRRPSTIIF